MLVRVELPWILGPYLYLRRTNEGSEEIAEAPYAIRCRENVARHVAE